MKSNFPHIGLAKLCGWFGVTRQAYYQNGWKGIEISIEEDLLLKEVQAIRKNHKRMGTRKLYEKLHPFMLDHQIKLGRDALFDLTARANTLNLFSSIFTLTLRPPKISLTTVALAKVGDSLSHSHFLQFRGIEFFMLYAQCSMLFSHARKTPGFEWFSVNQHD